MRPDVEEFFCGISFDAYRLLGSHPAGPGRGWLFTLWAPHARRVQLLGDWNGWDLYSAAELTFCEDGLWRGRVPQALRRFAKIDLQPGEEREVVFTLTPQDISRYSPELHAWCAAPGRYEIRIGHSSRDIRAVLPLQYADAKI